MKRQHRLRQPRQFQRVRRTGHSVSNHLLRVTVAPNRRRTSRCGFVVTKRFGTAVERNRARRRLREAVRLVFPHIQNGVDLVFTIYGRDILTIAFTDLQSALHHLLQTAHVWQPTPATPAPQPEPEKR